MFSFPAIALILANLSTLIGVFFLEWEVITILLFFWLENIVVGFYTVCRMLLTVKEGLKGLAEALPTILFFIFHYGLFTTGHGVILTEIFGSEKIGMIADDHVFDFIFQATWQIIDYYHLLGWMFILVLSHGVSFIIYDLIGGESDVGIKKIMFRPYRRIVILHVTVLLGGMLLEKLGTPLYGLILLIGLKIYMDLRAHNKIHRPATS